MLTARPCRYKRLGRIWCVVLSSNFEANRFELSVSFEDTYVSLIQTIRALAYSPSLHIYVMRPFRGQLELATASIVNRLRAEGDMNVFWLDTSGWLNTDVDLGGRADEQDFFLDGMP